MFKAVLKRAATKKSRSDLIHAEEGEDRFAELSAVGEPPASPGTGLACPQLPPIPQASALWGHPASPLPTPPREAGPGPQTAAKPYQRARRVPGCVHAAWGSLHPFELIHSTCFAGCWLLAALTQVDVEPRVGPRAGDWRQESSGRLCPKPLSSTFLSPQPHFLLLRRSKENSSPLIIQSRCSSFLSGWSSSTWPVPTKCPVPGTSPGLPCSHMGRGWCQARPSPDCLALWQSTSRPPSELLPSCHSIYETGR